MKHNEYEEIKQRNYWNSVADTKDFHSQFDMNMFSSLVNKDAIILDYGCGYGRTLMELQQYGYKNLVGLDFSEKMIERARKETSNIDFVIKDSKNIKFDDNYFDAVILLFVLASVYSDKEQNSIISDIKRVLKPNGYIFIGDALINEDERNIKRYNEFKDKYGVYGTFEGEDGLIARHLLTDRAEEITSNFEKVSFNKYVVKTQNGNTTNGFSFMGRNIK